MNRTFIFSSVGSVDIQHVIYAFWWYPVVPDCQCMKSDHDVDVVKESLGWVYGSIEEPTFIHASCV